MNEYEVEIPILGRFPELLQKQITKDIKFLKEEELEEGETYRTFVTVTIAAEQPHDAIYSAQKKLNEFLAFYSVTTFQHMKIIDGIHNVTKAKLLTGKKDIFKHIGIDFIILEIDGKEILQKILPFFPIMNKTGNEFLKTAAEYLRRARWEFFSESKILDCVVALESLFSKSGEGTEIGFRISNRAAILLGENSAKRLELRKEVRDFYNQRSKIVHGVTVNFSFEEFKNLLILTNESILRLLELAKLGMSHDQIIDMIDDAMIDNSKIKDLRIKSDNLQNIAFKSFSKSVKKFNKK